MIKSGSEDGLEYHIPIIMGNQFTKRQQMLHHAM